jgi:hypothetical protein
MSDNGSSGGLYGGPPPADDPWAQADPYRPAVDPYYQPAPYGEPSVSHSYADSGNYGSASPDEYGEGQPAPVGPGRLPPGWDLSAPPPPPPPKPRGGTGLIIVLIVILAVVLCGGVAGGFYLINVKGSPNAAASPTAHQSSPTPVASPTLDPAQITKGDCVINRGADDKHPQLVLVSCGPGVYQVLARFDGTIDTGKCVTVDGATHDYFYQTTPESQDIVLCLKLVK